MPITLTAAAQDALRNLLMDQPAGHGLRLYVEKGGCSGLSYEMKVAAPEPADAVIEFEGHGKVFVDIEAVPLLRGSVIDYEDTLTNTGFKIRNPNAKSTCGCGTSFEA